MPSSLLLLGLLVGSSAAFLFKTPHNRRQANDEVHVSDCSLDAEHRTDCGYHGIKQDECNSRDCCWVESSLPGVPWCYHSISQSSDVCAMNETERSDCGYYGVNPEICEGNGCCWKPSQIQNTPWCFHPSDPISGSDEHVCGSPAIKPAVVSRIVGGEAAIPHSWPWQVSLQFGDGAHGGCGGALIAPEWIITAAHCQAFFQKGTVALGLHYREYHTPNITEEINITFYQMHEDYGKKGMDSDITIIKLARPVTYTNEISPVCLPNKEPTEGTQCYATGWGRLKAGRGSDEPDVLQQVMVPIVDRYTCNDWYGGVLTENMICAGLEEGGADSCQRDSGGSFVCSDDGHWVLSGVVSWGEGCAFERYPGIYVNVVNFIDWINKIMEENP